MAPHCFSMGVARRFEGVRNSVGQWLDKGLVDMFVALADYSKMDNALIMYVQRGGDASGAVVMTPGQRFMLTSGNTLSVPVQGGSHYVFIFRERMDAARVWAFLKDVGRYIPTALYTRDSVSSDPSSIPAGPWRKDSAILEQMHQEYNKHSTYGNARVLTHQLWITQQQWEITGDRLDVLRLPALYKEMINGDKPGAGEKLVSALYMRVIEDIYGLIMEFLTPRGL